jgi:hypothetical protein
MLAAEGRRVRQKVRRARRSARKKRERSPSVVWAVEPEGEEEEEEAAETEAEQVLAEVEGDEKSPTSSSSMPDPVVVAT